MKRLITALLLAAASLVSSAAAAGYTIRELPGVPGDLFTRAFAVNEAGKAVGYSEGSAAPASWIAIFWGSSGSPTFVGSGFFSDINNRGVAVGATPLFQPFTWSEQRGITPLPLLPAAISANPYAINNRGDIVGYSFDGTFTTAVLYRNGHPQDLGGLPGFEAHVATAISESGLIAGISTQFEVTAGFFGAHAWLWQRGVFTDLGTFSGDDTQAYDVNNKGQVAGTVRGGGLVNRAFLWDERSGVTELWDNGGAGAGGLNARGDLVDGGMALLDGAQVSLLSLLGPNTGWESLIGYDINNQGTIVGLGYRECSEVVGQCPGRAFVMYRVDEPNAAALLAVALAVLRFCRRRATRVHHS